MPRLKKFDIDPVDEDDNGIADDLGTGDFVVINGGCRMVGDICR